MKNQIDKRIEAAVYDAMLYLGQNYMPTYKQLRGLKDYNLIETGEMVNGTWLANAIDKKGGILYWRDKLNLLSQTEYEAATKKWREEHGPNPYAGEEADGEHLQSTGTA